MGVVKEADSLNFFVEAQDISTSLLTVTASATGTYTGSDITITRHRGGTFFINFTTINATCTFVLGVQGKDPVSGNYATIAEVSMDGLTTGNIGCRSVQIYPGVVTTVGVAGEFHHDSMFPKILRVIASITATASVGGAAVSFTTGLSKTL